MLWFPGRRERSVIQTHASALVQVHVSVAEQASGHAPHVPRDLGGQFGRTHFQVGAELRAGAHLWDVEALPLPCKMKTQVRLPPGGSVRNTRAHLAGPPCCQRRSSPGCGGRA